MKQIISIALFAALCVPVLVSQDAERTPLPVDESSLIIESEPAANAISDRIGVFTAWDFVRMILILGVVIAVIYGIFFLLKRSGNTKLPENRLIRILSSRSIATGKAVHLVEVGNQVFLVGAAESNVSLLSEIVDKETLDSVRLQGASVEASAKRSFTETFSRMFGKAPPADERSADPVSFLQQQRQRVKQM